MVGKSRLPFPGNEANLFGGAKLGDGVEMDLIVISGDPLGLRIRRQRAKSAEIVGGGPFASCRNAKRRPSAIFRTTQLVMNSHRQNDSQTCAVVVANSFTTSWVFGHLPRKQSCLPVWPCISTS